MRGENWSSDSGVWSVSLLGRILSLEMPSANEVRALVRVKRKWWQLWRPRYDARCKVRARMDGTIIERT